MARNWQNIFQSGQPLAPQAVAQLSGMEVDLATALAFVNGGSQTFLAASNGTDDTTAIQAILTAGGNIAGKKGESYKISASLVAHSNTKLDLTGCTITLLAGSNCNMIHNAAWVAGSGRDSNIEILGGTWDRGANSGAGQGTHSMLMQRVDGLYIHDITTKSTAGKYFICPYACTNFVIGRITANVASAIIQCDGACSYFRISDIYGTSGDDSVAFSPVDWTAYQNGDFGDITDGIIENIYTTATLGDGVAVFGGTDGSSNHYHCRRLTISNVKGSFGNAAVILGGNEGQVATTGGNLYDITVDSAVNTNAGGKNVSIANVGAPGTIYNLVLSRIPFKDEAAGLTTIGVEASASSAVTVEKMTVRGCYLAGSTNTTAAISINDLGAGCTVNHLLIDDCELATTVAAYMIGLQGSAPTVGTIESRGCRLNGSGSGGLLHVSGTTPSLSNYIVSALDAKVTTWAIGDFGNGVATNVWLDGIVAGTITGLVNNRSGTTLTFRQATGLVGTNVRALASTGTIVNGHLVGAGAKATMAYSASVTPDCTKGTWQSVTATNSTAFTINAPTSPPDSSSSGELLINIFNNSGGALGAITWNGAFVFNGFVFTSPGTGKSRYARFEWNGAFWICTAVAGADF